MNIPEAMAATGLRLHWHIIMRGSQWTALSSLAGTLDSKPDEPASDLLALAAGLPESMELVAAPRCQDQHQDFEATSTIELGEQAVQGALGD